MNSQPATVNDAVIIEPPGEHRSSVIWLHGLGADGHDFEPVVPELGLDPALGIRFIFPHAPQRPVTINGGMVMRAWYDVQSPDLTQLEDADSIAASGRFLHELVTAEISKGIDSKRIVVAGFSQGGAIALHGGLRYSKPLAGILALSGYLPLPDRLMTEAHSANSATPIMMLHGSSDPIIPVQHGLSSRDRLMQAGYEVTWQEYPMPHSVCLEEIQTVGEWLQARLPS